MRGKPAVIAISAIAHLLALRWIAVPRAAIEVPVARPAPPPAPPPRSPPIATIDVELLPADATGKAGQAIAVHGGGGGGRGGGETGATHGSGDGGERTGAHYFQMRGPELGVGGDFVARLLANTRPLEVVAKSGKLAPAGGGTSVIRDRVTTVDVERDGTAHFHDAPDFDIHLELPLPTLADLRAMGRDLAAWTDDVYRDTRVGTMADQPRWILAEPGACKDANELWCQMPEETHRTTGAANDTTPIASGKAELTDYLMKKFAHADPYASRKLALLDSTRAERVQIGEQFRAQQLDRSGELVRWNLEALWRATPDPGARRDALFAMWDECAEGDGPVGEAGERARHAVIGWIRSHLPAGSPDAFTPDDIARRDAHRSSQQHFAPY